MAGEDDTSERKKPAVKLEDIMEKYVWVLGTAICTFIIVGLLYITSMAIMASGRMEYCYLDSEVFHNPSAQNVVIYKLWGFRPWRPDRLVSQNISTLEDAKAKAEAAGCQIKLKLPHLIRCSVRWMRPSCAGSSPKTRVPCGPTWDFQ